MRMLLTISLTMLAGLCLVTGCGSSGTEEQPAGQAPAQPAGSSEDARQPQQPPAGDGRQWSDYGPGDPRGDIKALQRAKETAREIEKSRQAPPEDEP